MEGSLEAFLAATEAGLAAEREAEVERLDGLLRDRSRKELQDMGLALAKLHVSEVRTGFRAWKIVSLGSSAAPPLRPLPANRFSTGDPISLCLSSSFPSADWRGTIVRLSEDSVVVSLDPRDGSEWPTEAELASKTLCLLPAANDVTFRRLDECIAQLRERDEWPGAHLTRLLFDEAPFPPDASSPVPPAAWYNGRLNEWQRRAVGLGLSEGCPFVVVHGPPGTGKTSTLVELVKQLVERGDRVLVAAPSNVGVDNVLERLLQGPGALKPAQLLRIGHPARSSPALRSVTLEARLEGGDEAALVADIRREMAGLLGQRRRDAKQLSALRKELKRREGQGTESAVRGARVIGGTLTSVAAGGALKALRRLRLHFDVVVVDEAAQALEVAVWQALLQGSRAVVAGDDLQLPPTLLSTSKEARPLATSLMARLRHQLQGEREGWLCLLREQYRMASPIASWASAASYSGRLLWPEDVGRRRLRDHCPQADCEERPELDSAILWVDTDGAEMEELTTEEGESRGNGGEARLVHLFVRRLVDAGLDPDQISLISPYNLQVEMLRCQLRGEFPQLGIKSVDGFQGQENEAVILSLVRSNPKRIVGFLADKRRLNVAVTRARRQVILIGDSATLSKDAFLKQLFDHVHKEGKVMSALELQSELDDLPLAYDTSELVRPAGPEKASESASKPPKEGPSTAKPKGKKASKSKPTKRQQESEAPAQSKAQVVEKSNQPPCWMAELGSRVEALAAGRKAALEFSPQLGPHQRRFLHEAAEQIGLSHTSVGEGVERRIRLEKKSDAKPSPAEPPKEEPEEEEEEAGPSRQPKEMAAKKPEGEKKAKKKPAKAGKKAQAKEEEDVDALIASFASESSKCRHPGGCKRSVALMGQRCSFCGATFCLAHAQAEVHGCGDAAKSAGRRAAKASAAGLGRPSALKEDRRRELAAKLSAKTAQLSKDRAPKPKEQ